MLVLLLVISGLLAALSAGSLLVLQSYRISRHQLSYDPEYNGPAQVSATLLAIIRYALKRSVLVRKFILQYIAHLAVRVMYYIDKLTTYLYSKSRNWFVRNAVRNRGTVPHFWEHLKVYKQEMDKEREDE
ncbi:MAG: hypothetical protein RIQ41_490 [Candidatus Parcubacteria bacterium]|jgi:hypothetical protein